MRTVLSLIVVAAAGATALTTVHAQAPVKPAPPMGALVMPPRSSDYLYLWTASADSTKPDFLAVVDVRPSAGRYGKIIGTVPVPGLHNVPHHSEHVMPEDGRLFVNGFGSGKSFIFDMRDPARPKLDGEFGDVAGMMHPHSYLRLANGNVLATFQMQHDAQGTAPGGLAELTNRGKVVRTVSDNVPGINRDVRPYSAVIVQSLDRIVTTTTDMAGKSSINTVQVWRLSDMKLLSTVNLPNGPRGNEGALTAEPRLLDDGKTVLISTFNCGLYLMKDVASANPTAQMVASFPTKKGMYCAIPVVAGNYYLVTVPSSNAVVSLDISNPEKPREVSRVTLNSGDVPHWISLEPNRERLVITGYADMNNRVVIANFNQFTGALTLDARFRDEGATAPGLRMDNKTWPHGGNAAGIPHGAVFSRPAR